MSNSHTSVAAILRELGNHLKYVKAEFEAEGTRSDELSLLKSIVTDSDSDLVIKIGGSSAIRDLIECATLETSYVLVPMIESPEALVDFLTKRRNFINTSNFPSSFSPVLINIETHTAVKKISEILNVASHFEEFKGVVIGRTDLTQSMQINKKDIDSDEVLNCCTYILNIAKEYNLMVTLGGSITRNSYEFVSRLMLKGLDAFETRKCCIKANSYDQVTFNTLVDRSLYFEQSILELLDSLSKIAYGQKINRIQTLSLRNQ